MGQQSGTAAATTPAIYQWCYRNSNLLTDFNAFAPSNSPNTCSPAQHPCLYMGISARWQSDLIYLLTHCPAKVIQDISPKLLLPSINTLSNYRRSEHNQTNAPVKVFSSKEKNLFLPSSSSSAPLLRSHVGWFKTVKLWRNCCPPPLPSSLPPLSFFLSFGLITGCQFIIKH